MGPTVAGLVEKTWLDLAARVVRFGPGTRSGVDPEDLHQMRVATRKLRALLSLFGPLLTEESHGDELRWLAGKLGEVRDLDVLAERLRSLTDDAGLEIALSMRRRQLRRCLVDALDSDRADRLLSRMAEPPKVVDGARDWPVALVGSDLLRNREGKLADAVKRARATGEEADWHAARIRAKRLRYAIEFLTPVYGPVSSPAQGRLADLQDVLGEHQDLATLRAWLEGRDLPKGLDDVVQKRMKDLRTQAPAAFARLGDPWRGLRREADRAARTAWRTMLVPA